MNSRGRRGDRERAALPAGEREARLAKGKHRQFYEGEARRNQLIGLVSTGYMVKDAVAEVGVTYGTYERWRSRFSDFAARVDAARNTAALDGGPRSGQVQPVGSAGFNFAQRRREFFRHDSPDFHIEVITLLEAIRPGNILMVILPPDHGKTTLYEDYASLKLADDPTWRTHIASETSQLSEKIAKRIRHRLDPPPGSFLQAFVRKHGPFAPVRGQQWVQPWTDAYYDVWRRGRIEEADDRDYNVATLGFSGQIIGSRSDHLHCDDLQSTRTLNRTGMYLERFRQDWLSRPGETGITTIFGNRVDEGDFYEALRAVIPPSILQVVEYPALLEDPDAPEGVRPLWPQKWSLEQLERMRAKVGDAAFERNWMMRPASRRLKTFTPDILDRCKNDSLSLTHPRPQDGHVVYIGVDPGLAGVTAMVTTQITYANRMRVVRVAKDRGFSRNEEIMAMLELQIEWALGSGFQVGSVKIESKNFQLGLVNDERLREMRARYGFNLSGHETGWNKYDPNIGVPSMATSFLKEEIELPWADDGFTRPTMEGYLADFIAWKPWKSGARLVQDQCMATWFAWLEWQSRRKKDDDDREDAAGITDQWRSGGVPWGSTASGLILPAGWRPGLSRVS